MKEKETTGHPVQKTCIICGESFLPNDESRLAICRIPGKSTGLVCDKCRHKKKYQIIDPNHQDFLL